MIIFDRSASAATFSRFIPSVKVRFDYGAMIFILTFSLVSVSGYRVDKLLDMAHQRLSTIIIGTSLCITVSMLVCPIWAGRELRSLITRNMDKLADSLEGVYYCTKCIYYGRYIYIYIFCHFSLRIFRFQYSGCVNEYFQEGGSLVESNKECQKKLQGYKCVLSSKATEESMVCERTKH